MTLLLLPIRKPLQLLTTFRMISSLHSSSPLLPRFHPSHFFTSRPSCLRSPPSSADSSGVVSTRRTQLAPISQSAHTLSPEVPYYTTFVDGTLGKEGLHTDNDQGKSFIIFLGTGTSEGVPRVSCLTNSTKKCPVCWAAVEVGNKNRRRNTSLMICYASSHGRHNILVDVGKFFYHSALQWFPHYRIRNLDGVIITHSHADAIGGLDDLRDWTNNVQDVVSIYVTQRDLEVLAKTHYYLVDTSVVMAGTAVSKLQFQIITEEPFYIHGLKVVPLPVWHGPGYRSLGFRVGNICYISDVSEIPEETYPLLEKCELLVLDALRPDRSSATHFGLPQALVEVRKIRPKQTLMIGMMHTMDHDQINKQLAELLISEGLDIQLSYDGLRIPVNL